VHNTDARLFMEISHASCNAQAYLKACWPV
jgi:hypothetical protein